MQRYRVNYRLLIILVVGGAAALGAAYGLRLYQVDRNANLLLDKADAAEKKGDVAETFRNLDQYLRFRPTEKETRVRLGKVAAEYVEEKDLPSTTRGEVYTSLVNAVVTTDDPTLRRKLVDLQMQFGAVDLALQNIDELLADGHADPELKAHKAQCLFATQKPAQAEAWCYRLIGYDKTSDTFDAAKAEAPDQPIVYALLAQHLKSGQPELVGRIMEQMVAVNPDSKEAQLIYFQYWKIADNDEKAAEALEKAYALDPTDAAVLTAKGAEEVAAFQREITQAQSPEMEDERKAAYAHLDEAAKYFREGLERYPERIDLYERLAQIEQFRENPDEALAIVEQALKKFPLKTKLNRAGIPLAINLENTKIDILLSEKKIDAARKEIAMLRELGNSRVEPLAEFHEARIIAVQENWTEAAAKLRAIKLRLLNYPDLQALASAIQGFCHMRLAQYDLALDAYDWALSKNPNLAQGQAGKREATSKINPDSQQSESFDLDRRIKEMLALPKEQQDWNKIHADIDAFLDNQALDRPVSETWLKSRKQLLRGQVYAMRATAAEDEQEKRNLFAEARKAITEAFQIDKDDPTVQEQAVRLIAQEPAWSDGKGGGPARALELLDKIVARGKDSAVFRALRVELLFAIRDEQLPQQLEAATQGMGEWTPAQQAMVWATVANRYEQLGKFDDSLRCLERAAELAPTNLPYRMSMFDVAVKQGDDVAMRNAQKRILEVVKNENDPQYILTEVKRRAVGFGNGTVSKEELQEARRMLDAAIEQRPKFSDLHVVSGQLYMLLEKDVEKALAAFDAALDFGAANLNAVNLQVRLLAERGRFQEARDRMNKIPAQAWAAVLDQVGPTVLLQVGDAERAFTEAEKVAAAHSTNDRIQTWFAEIAATAKHFDKAEEALKKATTLNASDPDNWMRLVAFYRQQKDGDKVEQALRDAHLALDAEFLPLLSAKYLELQSRWQEAEDIYLSIYTPRLDDLSVSRRMAEFYLAWTQANPANREKAAIYLNRLLRAGNEGKAPADDVNVAWARQQAARLLSQNRDYKDSLRAERLLTSNETELTDQQREFLIDILSLRGDPASRQRVVKLLQEMQQERALTPERELHLGHMLFELGQWEAAEKQMLAAIGRYPNNVGLQTALASMLIQKESFRQAESWIARVKTLPDTARSVAELQLRLDAAQGKRADIRKSLESLTPELRVLNEEQLQTVRSVALLADSVGDHEYAIKLMREFVHRTGGNELELARLIALHGSIDEALEMLRRLFDANMDEVIGIAVEMLRTRRSEAPEKLDAEVDRLVRQALRDDPESARRLALQAEVYEIQEKYDEAIAGYQKLLSRDDVPETMRATASNNLAFLLALNGRELDQALEAANEAAAVIGPISDILDTRALVYLARKEFDKAVDDLQLAVMVGATPSKYFHLTQALLGAGDEQAAQAAWKKAVELGIAPEKVSKLERDELDQLIQKMGPIAPPTAQL